MAKCKNCQCDCHCEGNLHTHHFDNDVCTCDNCACKNNKDRAEDSTYENNGGLVIDDTGECESCQ